MYWWYPEHWNTVSSSYVVTVLVGSEQSAFSQQARQWDLKLETKVWTSNIYGKTTGKTLQRDGRYWTVQPSVLEQLCAYIHIYIRMATEQTRTGFGRGDETIQRTRKL